MYDVRRRTVQNRAYVVVPFHVLFERQAGRAKFAGLLKHQKFASVKEEMLVVKGFLG